MNFSLHRLPRLFPIVAALGLMAANANAIPVIGTIESASNYSVVHTGSNPGGTQPIDEWFWFDENQLIALDYTGGLLTLAGPQSFSLSTHSGGAGDILITDMLLDLNDSDGFAGGFLSYVLNGQIAGSFSFANQHYGTSPFNSSSIENGVLSVYVWGGDQNNALGIDLGVSAPVPAPGTLLLIGLGGCGLLIGRRKNT